MSQDALESEVAIASGSRRALAGASWTLVGFGGGRMIRLASQLILTRLLAPTDFGLWAIVAATLAGLELFSDVGVGQSIVQNRDGDKPGFIGTAYSVQALRGAVLALLTAAAALPLSLLYAQPALASLLLAAALVPLLNGLVSPSIHLLTRSVRLRDPMLLRLAADVTGALVAIAWALQQPSVWALLAGNVTGALVVTLGSSFLEPRRSGFAWHPAHVRAILRFGTGILISSATAFLSGQTETLILGTFVDLATLGQIAIALLLANTLTGVLSRLSGRVLFPLLAEALRTDPAIAQRRISRVSAYGLVLGVPVALASMLGGEEFLGLLLDSRYAEAGWIFEILSARIALSITQAPVWSLLLAAGYTSYGAVANTLRFSATLAGIAIGFSWFDLTFVCWVLALADLPGYAVKLFGIARNFPAAYPRQLWIAAAMGLTVLAAGWTG